MKCRFIKTNLYYKNVKLVVCVQKIVSKCRNNFDNFTFALKSVFTPLIKLTTVLYQQTVPTVWPDE